MNHLQEADGGAMDADSPADAGAAATLLGNVPEVEMYCYLLVIIYLVDQRQYEQVRGAVQGPWWWFLSRFAPAADARAAGRRQGCGGAQRHRSIAPAAATTLCSQATEGCFI